MGAFGYDFRVTQRDRARMYVEIPDMPLVYHIDADYVCVDQRLLSKALASEALPLESKSYRRSS